MNWQFPTYEIDKGLNWEALCSRFQWVEDMKGVPQDPIWHAEGDVFIHTKMVVEALTQLPEFTALPAEEKHILVSAAVFHDVEKRSTTTTEIIDGVERIVAPRHAKLGEYTTRAILYRDLATPFEIREQIAKLVRLHGLPLWAISKENPAKEVIYASLVVNTEHLAMLAKADVLGRICTDTDELLLNIELFRELCKEHNCLGNPKAFGSNYGRYLYFNKKEASPDYVPYEDHKFEVIVMSALPGSGKDTYIKKHLDLPMLSLDAIRRENNIKPTDKKKNGRVIQMAKEKAKQYMRKKESFVFNATNITRDMRQKWISLFTEYGGRVKIIYLEVPYEQLKHQNHNRGHKVPEMVVEKMIGKLEIPTFKEAHDVEYHFE